MPRTLHIERLGRIRYGDAMAKMEARAAERLAGDAPDTVFLLEHEPVITLGRRADVANILRNPEQLAAQGVEVHETGRGGDVTYHGPGQIVAYPVLDLRPDREDVRRYVTDLEEVMIRTVAHYGLGASRVDKLNGTWVDGTRKVGAVGVRIARWITTHGLALNVNTDLDAFQLIVPCGLRDKAVTSIARERGAPVPLDEAMGVMARVFGEVFDADVVDAA
jgi:lipoyl(octanoyl) transferase